MMDGFDVWMGGSIWWCTVWYNRSNNNLSFEWPPVQLGPSCYVLPPSSSLSPPHPLLIPSRSYPYPFPFLSLPLTLLIPSCYVLSRFSHNERAIKIVNIKWGTWNLFIFKTGQFDELKRPATSKACNVQDQMDGVSSESTTRWKIQSVLHEIMVSKIWYWHLK